MRRPGQHGECAGGPDGRVDGKPPRKAQANLRRLSRPGCRTERCFELCAPGANQVKAGGSRRHGVIGLAGSGKHGLGDLALGSPALLRQSFHGPGYLLTRQLAFAGVTWQPAQDLQGMADRLDQLGPVNLANQSQGRDDVADSEVGFNLRGLPFANQRQRVRAVLPDPAVKRRQGVAALRRHALPQLCQVTTRDADALHRVVQVVEVLDAQGLGRVPGRVRYFPRDLVARNAVGHAAQVFKQHHAQGGREGPELAEGQFTDLLIGMEKRREKQGIENTVGVCDIGPGNAVDPRKTFQRLADELGKVGVVAVRDPLLDLLQLRFDQVKVIEQPFCCRSDVVPAARHTGDVVVRFAQCRNVLVDAREKGRVSKPAVASARRAYGLGKREAAAMLLEALGTEEFSPYRVLEFILCNKYLPGIGAQAVKPEQGCNSHTFKLAKTGWRRQEPEPPR